MKTIVLLVCLVIAIAVLSIVVVDDGGKKTGTTQGTQGLTVPNLGSYTVIATMNGDDNPPKVVTWYDKTELICVESGRTQPFRNQSAAFSCWNLNEAPVVFQKLVSGWKLGVPSYGEQREWPPQK